MTVPSPAVPPRVAGIVLAGGRASRFGRDKLAETIGERPLLHHALLGMAPAVDELVVVTRPHGAPPRLPSSAELGRPLRVVRDPEPYGGPLVALAAGLDAAEAPLAVLAGGDMPALHGAVLRAMIAALDRGGADVVLLARDNESEEPLHTIPAAFRVEAARVAAHAALAGGSRALRAAYDRLRVAFLPAAHWRALDPAGGTLRDVDTPADLERER